MQHYHALIFIFALFYIAVAGVLFYAAHSQDKHWSAEQQHSTASTAAMCALWLPLIIYSLICDLTEKK